jgi:hypothetical protein
MDTVQEWTGREARALRQALRMSVRGFAAYLGAGVRTVATWEANGAEVRPRPDWQAALDTALRRADSGARARFAAALARDRVPAIGTPTWDGAATDALAAFLAADRPLTPDAASRLSREWRSATPPQVAEVRAGRHIGARLARLVAERADVLRHMDDHHGGGELYDLVRRELRVTLDMVREASYTEEAGRTLLAAVGQLCQLAGWVASDAGLHGAAERYYLGGLSAARAARDAPLAAHLLSSLSYQVANNGDPRDAVLLATSAHEGAARTATPVARALLLERVAWAAARLGDSGAARRALDAVDDAYGDGTSGAEPAWAYWLDRDEIDVMAGRCRTELGDAHAAIALLAPPLERYDATRARELALYSSWLAEAHLGAGDVEAAAATATRALRLAAGVDSARSLARVRHLRALLERYRDVRAVAEFAAEADALPR